MPQKRTTKKTPAALRRGTKTPAELAKEVDRLAAVLGELRANVVTVEETGIKHLKIDGITKFDRGLELIQVYTQNVEIALLRARRRGEDESHSG